MSRPGLLLLATLWFASAATAKADDSDRLVDLGKFKAVIIHGTESKDGRYAVGWTIRTLKKGLKPVDWSFWDPDDSHKILDHYHMLEADGSDNYEVDYFAIDLKGKTTLAIPIDFYGIHGGVTAAWSGDTGGKRYGLLQFDHKWGTSVFLAGIDARGMQLDDVTEDMAGAVEAILPRGDSPNASNNIYVTYFYVTRDSDDKQLQVFHGAYADISFDSIAPHNQDSPGADGTVRLRLADAKVMRVSGDLPAADLEAQALQRNPELKKADDELNSVYRTLEKKLAPAAREALRKEQRDWIGTRNAAIDHAADFAPAGTSDFGPIRDNEQLELTRKRTAELQSRLVAH